jgi:hypothetical protein
MRSLKAARSKSTGRRGRGRLGVRPRRALGPVTRRARHERPTARRGVGSGPAARAARTGSSTCSRRRDQRIELLAAARAAYSGAQSRTPTRRHPHSGGDLVCLRAAEQFGVFVDVEENCLRPVPEEDDEAPLVAATQTLQEPAESSCGVAGRDDFVEIESGFASQRVHACTVAVPSDVSLGAPVSSEMAS